MARPGRPERNKATRSFRQLRRFHHVINSDKVFGTHNCAFLAERTEEGEVKRALKRMEEAWRTLAREQDQLDNKRWSKKTAPAADFYHPIRPLTAGFHVARRTDECPPCAADVPKRRQLGVTLNGGSRHW
jgi:hypothetical protein